MRSGGWNRKSPVQHALDGTRPRTPPCNAPLTAIALSTPATEVLDETSLAGLGPRGRAFALQTFVAYSNWRPHLITLLMEAAHLVDRLDTLRGQRAEIATQKTLLALIGALQLRD